MDLKSTVIFGRKCSLWKNFYKSANAYHRFETYKLAGIIFSSKIVVKNCGYTWMVF